MLIKVYITALKRFRIFSNLIDFQRVVVLCCQGKKYRSYIPTSKFIRSCSCGQIAFHSKLLLIFNQAF